MVITRSLLYREVSNVSWGYHTPDCNRHICHVERHVPTRVGKSMHILQLITYIMSSRSAVETSSIAPTLHVPCNTTSTDAV